MTSEITSFSIMTDAVPRDVGNVLSGLGYTLSGRTRSLGMYFGKFLIDVAPTEAALGEKRNLASALFELMGIALNPNAKDADIEKRMYEERLFRDRRFVKDARTRISIDPNIQEDSLRSPNLLDELRDETRKIRKALSARGYEAHAYLMRDLIEGESESYEMTSLDDA
jgi:hypothetical protein